MYDFVLVRHCKYSSILYRFWVIWRWIISWPWNLGQRSLKVIQTVCGFLLTFHSNYGSILHHFPDKTRYLSKIVIFHTLTFAAPIRGGSRRSIRPTIPFSAWQTDEQTNGRTDGIVRALHTRRAVKTRNKRRTMLSRFFFYRFSSVLINTAQSSTDTCVVAHPRPCITSRCSQCLYCR